MNKIKLNATSKTAFIDSPKLQKSPVRSLEQIPLIGYVKPASLTVETFRSRNSDAKVFDEWSFDAVNTSDNIEKCRLVWAMLNDFGLIKEFNIDLHVLCEFILKIKDKYCAHNNAFHNFDHGITGKNIFCALVYPLRSNAWSVLYSSSYLHQIHQPC